MYRVYFTPVDLIMPCYDIASIIAHRNNHIGMFHGKFLKVKYPPSAIGASSIEIQGMHMQCQRFSRLKLQLYSRQKGHPVMRIDDIKILVGHDPQYISSKKLYFLNYILSIDIPLVK